MPSLDGTNGLGGGFFAVLRGPFLAGPFIPFSSSFPYFIKSRFFYTGHQTTRCLLSCRGTGAQLTSCCQESAVFPARSCCRAVFYGSSGVEMRGGG